MKDLIKRAEGRAKLLEILLGVSLICFGCATVLASNIMAVLMKNATMVPQGGAGVFLVTIAHDLGYLVFSVLGAVMVSMVADAGRWRLSLALVLPNYFYEEMISYISGASGVYWMWPWGFLGRLSIMVAAVAVSILVQSRRKIKGNEV